MTTTDEDPVGGLARSLSRRSVTASALDRDQARESSAAAGGFTPRAHRVLIVDSDREVQRRLGGLLSDAGYNVAIAATVEQALRRIEEEPPRVVLTEAELPGSERFELVRRLRRKRATRWIPTIVHSVHGETADVVTGLRQGADDYVAKPCADDELLARIEVRISRPPVADELLSVERDTGLMGTQRFAEEVDREYTRYRRGGRPGVLALVSLLEQSSIELRLGLAFEKEVVRQVAGIVVDRSRSIDVAGRAPGGRIAVLLPEVRRGQIREILQELSDAIVSHDFVIGDERIRVTPLVGYVEFGDGDSPSQLMQRAEMALEYSAIGRDTEPRSWVPEMVPTAAPDDEAEPRGQRWRAVKEKLREPYQVALSFALGLFVPFLVYVVSDWLFIDISWAVYIAVVAGIVGTGLLIWVEGFYALKAPEPPEEYGSPPPLASAIIAAYLPNEAATVVETIEAFLRIEYEGGLEIILAYNSPDPMPVEDELDEIARRDPRFIPLRVEASESKAQNVNAAISRATGSFIGVFDADHQPEPDSYSRAWRWLSNGYDVVQGHCLVRNGGASWMAKLVATEFEGIYAVAHPGRAGLHAFGIFGGSNGYWRTDRLHDTRMRGSMLTEDIDSSMRVIEAGGRIASDRNLISRELATTTAMQVWNQRLRWAQGWFQVSRDHIGKGLRSPHLSVRQKLGYFHLLVWREFYPWLSMQIFPLIAFWAIKAGGLGNLDWFIPFFFACSVFAFSIGPSQVLLAWHLAHPDIKAHKRWFWFSLLMGVFYTEFKNLIARVAQIKEFMGERSWRVTPRTADDDESE